MACGGDESGVTSSDPCPPDAIWGRNVDGPDPADDTLQSDVVGGIGDTPDEAVQDLAAGVGAQLEVRATHPVDPVAHPHDDLDLDVLDGSGRSGTYQLAEKAGVWVVSGGEGCGAPPPAGFLDGFASGCPTPTPPPDAQPGDGFQVTC